MASPGWAGQIPFAPTQAACLESGGYDSDLVLHIDVVQPIMPPLALEFNASVAFVQSALVMMSLVAASSPAGAMFLAQQVGRCKRQKSY